MTQNKNLPYSTGNSELDQKIDDLIHSWGIEGSNADYRELVISIYKLSQLHPSQADLLLFNRSFKEMRYAQKVFAPYHHIKKITVFGSARILPQQPEYKAAKKFGEMMRESGYMIITGGGDGIMGAAQEGAGAENSFGLNIRLPFEQKANATILNDSKLLTFRYFFTRKLSFIKETNAVALFPGGFGTMDEGFEALTLIQTGKARLLPVVFIDVPGGTFWDTFEKYLKDHFLAGKLISPADFHLFKITKDLEEAREEIIHFYYNFHSYRFVGDQIVIRLNRPIPEDAIAQIQTDFSDIKVGSSLMRMSAPLNQEQNEPDLAHLPRFIFNFDRRSFGRLRQLIDRLNEF